MVASTKPGCKYLMSKVLEMVAINEDSLSKENREGEREQSGKCCGCKMVEVFSSAAVLEGSNESRLICLLY